MTGKFKPCMDILPSAQKRLWPELKNAPNLGFTLYGGTAIALRLGHRDSVDFDFFSEKPLDRNAIKTAFPFMEQSTTLQDQDNTWVVLVPYGNSEREHVKVSFFGTIAFGRVGEPDFTDDGVLQVASFDDLMATNEAIKAHGSDGVDWADVERKTIVESISEHGQPPLEVSDVICQHSPGSVTKAKQDDVRALVDGLAPELEAQYAKARSDKRCEQ